MAKRGTPSFPAPEKVSTKGPGFNLPRLKQRPKGLGGTRSSPNGPDLSNVAFKKGGIVKGKRGC